MIALCAAVPALAGAPDWVASGGSTRRCPKETFVIGFAAAGADTAAAAKLAAATDLSSRVVVRLENVQEQKNGDSKQEIAAVTRASTDVRLTGLTYETHADGNRAWGARG